MKQGAGEIVGRVRSTIIPLHGLELLVPNAVIAEVIEYKAPQTIEGNLPHWLMGAMAWRGLTLPMVSLELLLGKKQIPTTTRGRIVVLYGLGPVRQQLPYFGIVSRDLPRLEHVGNVNIEFDEGGISSPLLAANVVVGGNRASIPDFDRLTASIGSAL